MPPVCTRAPALTVPTEAGLDHVSEGRSTLGLGASGPQMIDVSTVYPTTPRWGSPTRWWRSAAASDSARASGRHRHTAWPGAVVPPCGVRVGSSLISAHRSPSGDQGRSLPRSADAWMGCSAQMVLPRSP
ncbi:hypothetical protein ACIRQQ_22870 [Streptomyces fuscichromogenes]|uniref:hypothetical protein n=1 Tax=Streptomyces fuscichromogenes TaxID=1324013 RepID=UPI0038076E35